MSPHKKIELKNSQIAIQFHAFACRVYCTRKNCLLHEKKTSSFLAWCLFVTKTKCSNCLQLWAVAIVAARSSVFSRTKKCVTIPRFKVFFTNKKYHFHFFNFSHQVKKFQKAARPFVRVMSPQKKIEFENSQIAIQFHAFACRVYCTRKNIWPRLVWCFFVTKKYFRV